MLRLTRNQQQAMITHALDDEPHECVGVLVRHVLTGEARVIRLRNISKSPTLQYKVSERETRELFLSLEDRQEYVDVVYHSHPTSPPVPSSHDIVNSTLDYAHYLILALSGRGPAMRSWQIAEGKVREEPVVIVTSED